MKSVLQGDTRYLMGGKQQGREVYYVSLKDLIATTNSNPATPVWKKLPKVLLENSTPAAFMNELIAIGGKESADLHTSHHGIFVPKFTSKIHAYYTSTRSWVHIQDMPNTCHSTCAATLPSGELFLVGTVNERGCLRNAVLKASTKGELQILFTNFVILFPQLLVCL